MVGPGTDNASRSSHHRNALMSGTATCGAGRVWVQPSAVRLQIEADARPVSAAAVLDELEELQRSGFNVRWPSVPARTPSTKVNGVHSQPAKLEPAAACRRGRSPRPMAEAQEVLEELADMEESGLRVIWQ